MNNNVIILIPYYKNNINELEEISLIQLKRVLKEYKKCFLLPQSVSVDELYLDSTCNVKKYPDEYFKDTASYSRLLLSPEFYKEFMDYEYMLIHQLDAFVFSNQLEFFCALEYDYIGAPWFRSTAVYEFVRGYVGNGGLSLRNISKTAKVLEDNMEYLKDRILNNLSIIGEDMVLSYLGTSTKYDYNIAPPNVAKKFSLECDFQKSFSKLEQQRPFGCHHWWNGDFDVWRKYVVEQGYNIKFSYPYIVKAHSQNVRKRSILKYLLIRIAKWGDNNKIKKIIESFLKKDGPVVIYGIGLVGKRCKKLLDAHHIDVAFFVDKGKCKSEYNGTRIVVPNEEILKNCPYPIIVTSVKYYNEIANNLNSMRLKEGIDYFDYVKLGQYMVQEYYKSESFIVSSNT